MFLAKKWALLARNTALKACDLIAECIAIQVIVIHELLNNVLVSENLTDELIKKSLQTRNHKIIVESYLIVSTSLMNEREQVKLLLRAYRFTNNDRAGSLQPLLADLISQALQKLNKHKWSSIFLYEAVRGYRYRALHDISNLSISTVLIDNKQGSLFRHFVG